MPSLVELSELVGFFSYSRDDDEAFKGKLSSLRDGIERELSAQLGRSRRTFRVWQDQEAIAPGKLWESEIKKAIDESFFFIPIVTPRSINSKYCKFELEAFLAREKGLGRSDLVFPILYISVAALENDANWRNDPVLSTIGQRQYLDWRSQRHLDIETSQVREKIERFCQRIVEALYQPWTSPEERRRAEEAKRADEEQQRRSSAKVRQQAEEERRLLAEAKQKAEEERAEIGRRAEEERRRAEAPIADEAERGARASASFTRMIFFGMGLILASAAILLLGKPVVTSVSDLFNLSTQVVETPKNAFAPAVKPQIPGSVGQPALLSPATPDALRIEVDPMMETVRAFYAALGSADGDRAASLVIPEKRGSAPFSAVDIKKYYATLSKPFQLDGVTPRGDNKYQADYSYGGAGNSTCTGSAVVTVVQRDGIPLIQSIKAKTSKDRCS
jgi:hypothetical protein